MEPSNDIVVWLNQGVSPEARLLAFDRWVRVQLLNRLDWGWAGDFREKRIEQCQVYLERIVLDLWRRGWLLDGSRLAAHLVKALDTMGNYQRGGHVREFWPYFKACVDRYVGGNAEELRSEAMAAGTHIGQLFTAMGIDRKPAKVSMPELVAQRAAEIAQAKEESLRVKLARQRARNAACKADAGQQQLPLS